MRDDICFVAVGQCGGNNGLLFEKAGYDVFYINTARDDVNTLKGAKHVYVTPGTHGCNQDANKAKAILGQYSDEILAKIDQFARKRVVYFISSSGGGTSAMTPLLMELFMDHLREREYKEWDAYEAGTSAVVPIHRTVGLITCLPSIAESAQINANAYTYLQEVVDLTLRAFEEEFPFMASVFLVDNENTSNKLQLNEQFVAAFDEFVQIPDKHHSVKGNVDAADLNKAFTSPGVAILVKLESGAGVQELVNAVKHNGVFAGSEDSSGMYWVSSTKEELQTLEIEKELGAPRAHFYTFNDEADYFLISGMGFPKERLDVMGQRAREFSQTARKLSADLANSSLDQDMSFMHEPLVVKTQRPQIQRPERKQTTVLTEGELKVQDEPVKAAPVTSARDRLNAARVRRPF